MTQSLARDFTARGQWLAAVREERREQFRTRFGGDFPQLCSFAGQIIIIGALCLGASLPASAQQGQLATVTVQTRQLGKTIPADFVGLSLEVSTAGQGLAVPPADRQMGKPAGPGAEYAYSLGEPGWPNTTFFKFMRNLGPGILRLGGNSQDNTCWDAKDAPHPDWCKAPITHADMQLYSAAAQASGWKLILGLNLKQNSAQWAEREVSEGVAKDIKSSELLGLEIGNEHDLYERDGKRPGKYSAAADARDFLTYVKAFRANPATRSFAAMGPASCCAWRNPRDLATFIDGVGPNNLKLVTVHNYSTTTCGNRTVTARELLSRELMDRYDREVKALVAVADQRHLPIAMAETNSASCGGMKGVSNAFTSTLWGLDFLFVSAEDGFTGVNYHISYRAGGSAYNPVDTIGWKNGTKGWTFKNKAEPLYYAMYMFARNASGGHVLPTEVQTSSNVTAYAVSACSGCADKIFVLNKDLTASGEVRVHLTGPMGDASLLLLDAPKVDSLAEDVRYGGAQFDEQANIAAPKETLVKPGSDGDYVFTLPNAAVALLTVEPAEQTVAH